MRHVDELILAAIVIGTAFAQPALAAESCDRSGQVVEQVMASKVAVYDAGGNIQGTIAKDKIVAKEAILECMNDPQLVRVHVHDDALGRKVGAETVLSVWVDRLEVKISGAEKKIRPQCKAGPPSAANDKKVPAVSGIDPCSGS